MTKFCTVSLFFYILNQGKKVELISYVKRYGISSKIKVFMYKDLISLLITFIVIYHLRKSHYNINQLPNQSQLKRFYE